jgi:hypothetical protein
VEDNVIGQWIRRRFGRAWLQALAACALAVVVVSSPAPGYPAAAALGEPSGPVPPAPDARPAPVAPPSAPFGDADRMQTPGAIRRQVSIAGGGFVPAEDRAAYSTTSGACRYERSGGAVPLVLQAAVQLPSQATLVWLDLGGVDNDASGDQTLEFWETDLAGNVTQLGSLGSSGAPGAFRNYVTLNNHVTDAFNNTYTLSWAHTGAAGSTLQLCGAVVSYDVPFGLSFVPQQLYNATRP